MAETTPALEAVGVAAVRLADGRQVFVEGAPRDLPMGAQVRLVLDGEEQIGMVTIMPQDLIWRDPSARCATFVRLEWVPDPLVVASAPSVKALFLAEHDAPDARTLAAMLALAMTESARLDT